LKAQASTATEPHQLTQNTVGWGNAAQNEPSFGGGSAQDGASVKAKTINLINSVRTLMRSEYRNLLASATTTQESRLTRFSTTVPLIFLNIMIIVWAVAFG
jgi:hypothetical protein